MTSRWNRVVVIALLLMVPLARGGWRSRLLAPPSPPSDVIGLPLTGAEDVGAIRALLVRTDRDAAIQIIVHPEMPSVVLNYLQYQLDHLEYPRRLEVWRASSPRGAPGRWLILGPGIEMTDAPSPVAIVKGYRLLRIAG